jgi:hypothetical protein
MSEAKVLDHDNQSNDFRDADSSKPQFDGQNVEAPHRAEITSSALSPEARPTLKVAIGSL